MAPEEESRLMLQEEDRGRMASSDLDILNPEGNVPESILKNREHLLQQIMPTKKAWQGPIKSLEDIFPRDFANRIDFLERTMYVPGRPDSYKAFALAKKKGYKRAYRDFVFDVFSGRIDPTNPVIGYQSSSKPKYSAGVIEILSKFVA